MKNHFLFDKNIWKNPKIYSGDVTFIQDSRVLMLHPVASWITLKTLLYKLCFYDIFLSIHVCDFKLFLWHIFVIERKCCSASFFFLSSFNDSSFNAMESSFRWYFFILWEIGKWLAFNKTIKGLKSKWVSELVWQNILHKSYSYLNTYSMKLFLNKIG